jgi:predicted amidophosphoribosyltransferase
LLVEASEMRDENCSECGAELRLRPASCPLCGRAIPYARKEPVHIDLDDYQSNVRSLHDELRRIRGDEAEAV